MACHSHRKVTEMKMHIQMCMILLCLFFMGSSEIFKHHKHFQKLYDRLKREYEFISDDLANLKCLVRWIDTSFPSPYAWIFDRYIIIAQIICDGVIFPYKYTMCADQNRVIDAFVSLLLSRIWSIYGFLIVAHKIYVYFVGKMDRIPVPWKKRNS